MPPEHLEKNTTTNALFLPRSQASPALRESNKTLRNHNRSRQTMRGPPVIPKRKAMPSQRQTAKSSGYDSDEGPPHGTAASRRLNWRLDPCESLSDWTVHIISTSQGSDDDDDDETHSKTDTYHVHRNILAVGPRKSDYFLAVFQGGNRYPESQSCTSTIRLHELAAKAFPALLDYLYSTEGDLNVSTENATALHYLGQYFQMSGLRWEAKKFWKKDLTVQNCVTYFRHGLIFQDEKILRAVALVCAKNIMKITTESPIFDASDEQLWLDLLEILASDDDKTTKAKVSRHTSKLLADYCCKNRNDIEVEVFAKLTDVEYIPEIHVDAVCKLLAVEKHLVGTGIDKQPQVVSPNNNIDGVSCLQQRCIRALSMGWEKIDVSKPDVMDFLSQQSPILLSKLLAASLTNAQQKCEKLKKEREDAKKRRKSQREGTTKSPLTVVDWPALYMNGS